MSMFDQIKESIIGFRNGRWVDEGPAGEIAAIAIRHIVADIDKRIAREQMGGGFGVVVDAFEHMRATLLKDAPA